MTTEILGADGQPLADPEPVSDLSEWWRDINTEGLIERDGHWFEIVGIGPEGMVLKHKGPTGKTRRDKECRQKQNQ